MQPQDAQNYRNMCPKVFDLKKNETAQKRYYQIHNFILFLFYSAIDAQRLDDKKFSKLAEIIRQLKEFRF